MKVIHRAKAKRYKKKAWLQGHPKTGSWHTKRFIHGPRLVQPEKFDSFYLFDREKAEDRHVNVPKSAFARIKKYAQKENLRLVKDWREKAKVKVGTKNGKLKAQSLLTPIKNYGAITIPLSKKLGNITITNKELIEALKQESIKKTMKAQIIMDIIRTRPDIWRKRAKIWRAGPGFVFRDVDYD